MSLPRNDQTEPISKRPLMSLDDLWAQMLAMRQDSAQSAEDKFQVALLLATVNKLCAEQTTFMSKAESKLNLISSNQLETLSLQEQYKKEIGDNAIRLLRSLYNGIQERQNSVFEEFSEKNNAAIEKMTEAAKSCTEQINKAANHAAAATKAMFRITHIADLMYYIASLAVIGSFVLRLIEFFG